MPRPSREEENLISTADIAIIGGGVQGASLAYHLARAKAGKIVLLEKNYIASGPTAKSSAMIRPLFTDAVYIQLVQAAIARFEDWDEWVGGDPGFVQTGFLRIADGLDVDDPAGFPDFDLDLMQSLGAEFEILQVAELSALAPGAEFRGDEKGIFFPRGGCADPVFTTRSLAAAARRHGVEIIEGVSVTGIQVEPGRIDSIQTDGGRISTRTAVNCGGSWGLSAIYDMTPDGHPIVGQTPEVEGFWCSCGWSGNGFASAPVFGGCLAAEILGSGSEIDLSLFKWPRPSGVKNRRH